MARLMTAPLTLAPRRSWWPAAGPALFLVALLVAATGYTIAVGIGVWGNNIPVAWGFAITNFVWWIGIGHAGTFISAFLLLLNQSWRASINRIAETMTLLALVNAALFPVLHLGRPWFFYWLVPYPARFQVWPNFLSALPWDLAAIATYFIVSLLFWYLGLVPDFARRRDRADGWRARGYGLLAIGWRSAGAEWQQHRIGYGLLAALAAPLVISVHSIVSLDFAITQLPGWHSTLFPPYFVAGAIYSGLGMVMVLLIPVRRVLRLEHLITARHLDNLAKLTLAIGLMLGYSYLISITMTWYGGNTFEQYHVFVQQARGGYAVLFWIMLVLNVGTPQLFWSRRLRRDPRVLVGAGLAILIGMWIERFVIVTSSLSRDFLPSSWNSFTPTGVDWALLAGSLGLFAAGFLAFLRFLPVIPASEVKRLAAEQASA